MSAQYNSKHGIVSRPQTDLYMTFTDLRNFGSMIPHNEQAEVQADFDTLRATVHGFTIGVRVTDRHPYDRIVVEDIDAPFHFMVIFRFEEVAGQSGQTDFSIEVEADLNLMMKMALGKKLQDGLDKMVDALVAISEGRMPEGIDPEMFKNGNSGF